MKQTVTLLLLYLSITATAQFKVITQSEDFEIPESDNAAILQLKNGNTAFLYCNKGIELVIYDDQHKEKVAKHIDPACKSMVRMDGVFDIGGDIVLFIDSHEDDRKPALYRMVIDARSGTVKEDKKIAESETDLKVSRIQDGGIDSEFSIRKSISSDYYAVSVFNNMTKDKNRRLQVMMFAPDHKELANGWFSLQENKHEWVDYLDMDVVGKESVCVLAYTYNKSRNEPTDQELVIAELVAGTKELKLNSSNFLKDRKVEGAVVRYHPAMKKLLLLALTRGKTTNNAWNKKRTTEYGVYTATIVAGSYETDRVQNTYAKDSDGENLELFGDMFNGFPQNIYINRDGSYAVIYEEVLNTEGSRTGPALGATGQVAIVTYDLEGRETGRFLVPKKPRLSDFNGSAFYSSKQQRNSRSLKAGRLYEPIAYLDAGEKKFILFNDLEANGPTAVAVITSKSDLVELNAFYSWLGGNTTRLQRQYLVDSPRQRHNLAAFIMGDYNPARNIYVTLRTVIDGRKKTSHIVWLQPK
jgi:hypothetical protein